MPTLSMFPHTITLYNVAVELDKTTFEDKLVNHITILKGVLVDDSKAHNVRESGLVGADAVNLYIPYEVEAVDGVTGEKKAYAPPIEFWKSDDKDGMWTLSLTSKNPEADSNTFFVRGEVVEPDMALSRLELLYDDVYEITKVDNKDFGGLRHWEVGAS